MPDTTTAPAPDAEAWRRTSNMPPRESIAERVKERIAGANTWMQIKRIRTKEEAGKCASLLEQLLKERQAVDAERKAEKRVHDEAAAEVQRFYCPLIDAIDVARSLLTALEKPWLDLERLELEEQRRAAEEAAAKAQAEAEAAAKAAQDTTQPQAVERQLAAQAAAERAADAEATAARAAKAKPQIVSEYTGRARGYRTEWFAEITDRRKAAAALCDHPWVIDAVQRAANNAAKSTKAATKIDGVAVKSRQVI